MSCKEFCASGRDNLLSRLQATRSDGTTQPRLGPRILGLSLLVGDDDLSRRNLSLDQLVLAWCRLQASGGSRRQGVNCHRSKLTVRTQSNAWPAQQRTSLTLCRTSSLTFVRAGPRYLRGSNSFGVSHITFRMAAVMASRRSVSMLTLVQPTRRAISMSASGTPAVSSPSLPPYLLISSAKSFGTL